MDKLELKGKVAIITGSSAGIGEATALLMAKRGARVTIHGRDQKRLQSVKEKIVSEGVTPENILIVRGDISDQIVRQYIIDDTITQFGQLDILVNNAGAGKMSFLRDIPENTLDACMDVLYKAPVLLTKVALPHLIKSKGNIVNVSTMATIEAYPAFGAYGSAKAALNYFTRCAAVEFGQLGIRVNSVLPGVTVTPFFVPLFEGAPDIEAAIKNFLVTQQKNAICGRNGQPDDVAEMIAFLASDAASYINGSEIFVDGGRHMFYNRNNSAPMPTYDDLIN